ncbi:TPA: hypothetical protein ACHY2E_005065 [Pseudomonas aeruginosa]
MNKANECTCPSGDGSLVHPCPAHPAVEQACWDERKLSDLGNELHNLSCSIVHENEKLAEQIGGIARELWNWPQACAALAQPSPAHPAPVEQAGGDERAAFEAAFAAMGRPVCRADYDQDAYGTPFDDGGWTGWQARAALAQPSPKCATCNDSGQIVVSGPHYQGEFQPPEYETEPCDMCAQPSPAQAEQAEAERPEVVARVVHSNPVVLGQCGPLNANDELMTVAQHAASVARWAEMFNRVEQQRDAAMARVAELEAHCVRLGQGGAERYWENRWRDADARLQELEKQEPAATVAKVPGEDWNSLDFHLDLQGMLPGTKLYTTPVAQAPRSDHSELRRIAVALKNPLLSGDEASDLMVRYEALTMPDHIIALIDSQALHSVPEASEQEKEQGWTLDYRFVERVTDLAASRTEYTTSMEATEQVLLAARELLAAAPGRAQPGEAQYSAPAELRAICMLVAEAGIKYGRGRHRAVASDECREVVDSVLPLEPSRSNSEQHCLPEIMAVAEGVLTFMRSEKDNSQCTCCNGPHIFCRYFDGMSDFDDITLKARFRNDLEGRTFRLVLELLPAGGPGKEGV